MTVDELIQALQTLSQQGEGATRIVHYDMEYSCHFEVTEAKIDMCNIDSMRAPDERVVIVD